MINTVTEIPTHPLHRLYEDDELEKQLDSVVLLAFGQNLVVNRGAGRQVMLQLGNRPTIPAGKDRLSTEFRDAVNALPSIHEQGDGVRAFVGIVMSVLAADRDIILVDEPEAFLHPPQAMQLGRVLAEQSPTEQQLIIATHSADFLRGMLDHSSPRIRVVRINRHDKINHVTQLKPEVVRTVWSNPLLRFSKVLDGLFHDGTIICEGDADCRFYEAMIDAVSRDVPRPDLSFVHGAGKSRIADIVIALRAIGVPVRVVVDIDVLANENELKKIVESIGGEWSQIASASKRLKSTVERMRAQIPTKDAKRDISAALSAERGDTLSLATIQGVREVLKRGSAWQEAKRLGKSFLPAGDDAKTYDRMAIDLQTMGIYLVEVGELECFCKTVDSHGPAWVVEVLQRDLITDDELAAARSFAKKLITGWPSHPSLFA